MTRLRGRKREIISQRKPWTTEEQIAKALKASGGLITHAARKLGVTQPAVSQRVKSSEFLQAVIQEITESTLDLAESQLMEKIREGHIAAIIFYLKTKGRDRGFSERMEINANINAKAGVLVVPPMAESVEAWEQSYQETVIEGSQKPLTEKGIL